MAYFFSRGICIPIWHEYRQKRRKRVVWEQIESTTMRSICSQSIHSPLDIGSDIRIVLHPMVSISLKCFVHIPQREHCDHVESQYSTLNNIWKAIVQGVFLKSTPTVNIPWWNSSQGVLNIAWRLIFIENFGRFLLPFSYSCLSNCSNQKVFKFFFVPWCCSKYLTCP